MSLKGKWVSIEDKDVWLEIDKDEPGTGTFSGRGSVKTPNLGYRQLNVEGHYGFLNGNPGMVFSVRGFHRDSAWTETLIFGTAGVASDYHNLAELKFNGGIADLTKGGASGTLDFNVRMVRRSQ